jgi:hypothetical protein
VEGISHDVMLDDAESILEKYGDLADKMNL